MYYSKDFKEFLLKNNRLTQNGDVIWKRAKDMSRDVKFVADKNGFKCNPLPNSYLDFKNCIRCTDLNQGFIGNCWFVAAASGIIENIDLFKKIVPFDNSFSNDEYSGYFKNCLYYLKQIQFNSSTINNSKKY